MANRQEPKCDTCPKEQMIDEIYERVITGNGEKALMTRTDALETEVKSIAKIVRGDGEKTGLQPQMIAMNASIRMMNWLLATIIAILLVIGTVFGPKLIKISDAGPTHINGLPAAYEGGN